MAQSARARYWNTARRKKAAEDGDALPDGSFPIANCTDVENAIRDLNRIPEGERETARRHIAKRALALGCPLPESWHMRRA